MEFWVLSTSLEEMPRFGGHILLVCELRHGDYNDDDGADPQISLGGKNRNKYGSGLYTYNLGEEHFVKANRDILQTHQRAGKSP